ncbi:MAG: fatty acid desaturase [Candidatus Eisenbacteria bacterium]|nr:fatty acid desaturase [Candidatus Eisenbacteria bacterium]
MSSLTSTSPLSPEIPVNPLTDRNHEATNREHWRSAVAAYERSDLRRSLWQITNSFVPYLALWFLMYLSLSTSYWLTLAMAPLAAAFLVRIFIIAHDCGHGSFFRSPRANNFVGSIAASMVFTAYGNWRHRHAIHHASAGDLEKRDIGDVWTLTAKEYLAAPFWRRFSYRFYRNPLVLFVAGPVFYFLIYNRVPQRNTKQEARRSVVRTNLALAAVILLAAMTIGLKAYLLIQLPIIVFAGTAGAWLFYVQHQFEGVYWERTPKWNYVSQALEGSSYYRLPKLLQWFSGNIGFHHVHHLSPRIPNYYLERCHREERLFRGAKEITLLSGFRALRYRLWDEDRRQLIGFGDLRTEMSPRAQGASPSRLGPARSARRGLSRHPGR